MPQDYVTAHAWFNLAAAQGNENATDYRDEIASQMTAQQLSAAQDLARGRRNDRDGRVRPTLYLSRARLRRDASAKALLPLLLGKGSDSRSSQQPGHHLVWSLFADTADRRRDFLWREMEPGAFLMLSERKPVDRHGLFEVDEARPFRPALEPGDRLRFSLRANPVVRRRGTGRRSVKHDVVMDALHSRPNGERAKHRRLAVWDQGFAWLRRQGERAGFDLGVNDVEIDGYQQHHCERASGHWMRFSTIDFNGVLTVGDVEMFLSSVARGFGATKAYGCGLMLIRRA